MAFRGALTRFACEVGSVTASSAAACLRVPPGRMSRRCFSSASSTYRPSGCQTPLRRQVRHNTVLRGAKSSNDPWKLLGVPRSASEGDLKKAYLSMAKQHHPDRTGGDDTKFKQVKEAYESIKSGEAERMYPQFSAAGTGGGPTPDAPNTSGRWSNSYGSYAEQKPPGFENMQYSSSATSTDRFGTQETVYTFRDESGQTFTYRETKHGGDENFWNAYTRAQNEALNREAERMKERANANDEFRKVFENWATHKTMQSVDYQQYVKARDRAFYRFVVLWFWVFIFLRICINLMV